MTGEPREVRVRGKKESETEKGRGGGGGRHGGESERGILINRKTFHFDRDGEKRE